MARSCAEGWWAPYGPQYKHSMFSLLQDPHGNGHRVCGAGGPTLRWRKSSWDIFPDLCPEDPSAKTCARPHIYSLLTMSLRATKTRSPPRRTRVPTGSPPSCTTSSRMRPARCFSYNTPPGTNMLAAILRRKTGMALTEFLEPRLLAPLGIENARCLRLADGVEARRRGVFPLYGDMARFAQFYLQRGVWEGKRLLQESWFDRASAAQDCDRQPDLYEPRLQLAARLWVPDVALHPGRRLPHGRRVRAVRRDLPGAGRGRGDQLGLRLSGRPAQHPLGHDPARHAGRAPARECAGRRQRSRARCRASPCPRPGACAAAQGRAPWGGQDLCGKGRDPPALWG